MSYMQGGLLRSAHRITRRSAPIWVDCSTYLSRMPESRPRWQNQASRPQCRARGASLPTITNKMALLLILGLDHRVEVRHIGALNHSKGTPAPAPTTELQDRQGQCPRPSLAGLLRREPPVHIPDVLLLEVLSLDRSNMEHRREVLICGRYGSDAAATNQQTLQPTYGTQDNSGKSTGFSLPPGLGKSVHGISGGGGVGDPDLHRSSAEERVCPRCNINVKSNVPGTPPWFQTCSLCRTSLCAACCPPSSGSCSLCAISIGRDCILPPHVFGQATRPPLSSLPSEANKCANIELKKLDDEWPGSIEAS